MSIKKKKIIFYILDFLFLMASYMLCDFIAEKTNLLLGITVGLISYIVIIFILCKISKIHKSCYNQKKIQN